jgi:hypothetical protein
MHLLGTRGASPHQLAIQKVRQPARLLRHRRRQLQRSLQHIVLPLQHFLEQAAKVLRVAREHVARREQVHGVGVADQTWQEEGRVRLHGDAAPGEDEAVFGLGVSNPDRGRESHGHAEADGGAVHGDDGRLAAAVDGEVEAAATAPLSIGNTADV